MTADDAALYEERDEALLRAERAEIELEAADRRIDVLERVLERFRKANGWYYRKWHVAAREVARLRKANPINSWAANQ